MSDLVPQLIAGRWVSVELTVDGATVRVRFGINVNEVGELLGDALAVHVVAGEETLGELSAPQADLPLLCVSTTAAWAWGEYSFANPRGLTPTAILVTFEGQTASFDLRDAIPSPAPPAPPAAVGLSVAVLRPDDLVDLVIDTVNLRLDISEPRLPVLVREEAEQDALLIVRFPPQTIVEEAFFETEATGKPYRPEDLGQPPRLTTSSTVPDAGQVAARLGEETRLVFRIPDGVSVPYSIDGLLDWSRLQLVVAPIADVKAGGDPGPDALSIRPPQPTESTLQLPYRLHLSPSGDVAWDHSRSPVMHGERAELWHTRLCMRTPEGEPQPTDAVHTVGLRAIWSPDYPAVRSPHPATWDRSGTWRRCPAMTATRSWS